MPQPDPFDLMTRLNALAYGPIVGETGRAQMIGAYNNKLGPRDVALSPGLLSQYPLGSTIAAVDARGNPIGNYTVADTSYGPKGATTSTIEFRDRDISNQPVFIRNLADAPMVTVNPPAGGGNMPGGAMPGYPDLSNAPMVTADPSSAANVFDYLTPRTPGNPFAPGGGGSPEQQQRTLLEQILAGNFAQQQNYNAFAHADWNRNMWGTNPVAGEGGLRPSARHNIGALAARFGLRGRGDSGRMPVTFQ